jgi:hypothetical protein
MPGKHDYEDWGCLALLVVTAVYLVVSESFWNLLPF